MTKKPEDDQQSSTSADFDDARFSPASWPRPRLGRSRTSFFRAAGFTNYYTINKIDMGSNRWLRQQQVDV